MVIHPRARVPGTGPILALLVLLNAGMAAQAQAPDSALPSPRLLTLVPSGAKIGTTVEVTFSGVDLEEPEKLVFSHPGIKAEPIVPPAPAVDPKKPMPAAPKPPITKFKVNVAPDVPLGNHDCRLVNKWGISNPRVFVIGDLNEVLEKEPNNDVETAQRVELNTTISGNMAAPTDVDYYVFAGKKGQRVIFSCLASSIDSRFVAGLEIYDAKGKLIAHNRNYDYYDALADAVLDVDGDFYVRVFEFTYTMGTAEHFYRLSITTAPWIDAIFPPVVEPGKPAQLTIHGRNLPGGVADPTAVIEGSVLEKLTVTVPVPADPASLQRLNFSGWLGTKSAALDGFEYRLKGPGGASNPYLLTYAKAPVVVDNGANDTMETAQAITLPCEIAGRVEKRRDRDWFTFTAKKGDSYQIDVLSDRLGSPAFMYYRWCKVGDKDKLTDFTESQDNPEFLVNKFHAGSEDPLPYRFTADADAKYFFMVASRNADTLADPRHLYRMRIAPAQPDFRLIAMPYSILRPEGNILHPGGSLGITVIPIREDGFNGNIQLAVEGLPAGVTCLPQTVGPTLKETNLVLSAAPGAAPFTGEIKIKGTATIKGQPVVREARPGGIVWPLPPPNPAPARSRLERGLWLAVRGQAPYNVAATIDKPAIVQGDKGTVTATLTRIWPDFKTPLTVQALPTELPVGLTVGNNAAVTIAPTANSAALPVVVAPTTLPGTYTIVLKSISQIPFNKDPKAPMKPATNVVLASTPVVLTILPKTLATLTLANPNPTVKAGMPLEVVVRVARQFSYTEPFKVQLVLPPAVKDVTAADVTIPADKDEAKLTLAVPAGAAPGARAGLIVRVTALYEGKTPIVHDVVMNLNVVK